MPGIRGVGKTTLLMQISKFEKYLCPKDIILLQNLPKLEERLYLDVSKLNLIRYILG
jgi:predicted AAA+ superfamily ATPase